MGVNSKGSKTPPNRSFLLSLRRSTNLKTFSSAQRLEKAEELAKKMEIAFTAGEGEAAQDTEWIGEIFGVSQLFVRRKTSDAELQMRVYQFVVDRSSRILHKDDGLYAAGFLDSQVEPLLKIN